MNCQHKMGSSHAELNPGRESKQRDGVLSPPIPSRRASLLLLPLDLVYGEVGHELSDPASSHGRGLIFWRLNEVEDHSQVRGKPISHRVIVGEILHDVEIQRPALGYGQ